MAMSDEHKEALAAGRRQARAIKAYLDALAERRPGRPVTHATLTERIIALTAKIESETDPLKAVDLRQQRFDAEKQLDSLGEVVDFSILEAGFVEYARAYSDRKGITYSVWREMDVPAETLRKAQIPRTRRT